MDFGGDADFGGHADHGGDGLPGRGDSPGHDAAPERPHPTATASDTHATPPTPEGRRPDARSESDRRTTATRRVRVTSPQTRIALSRRHRPAQQLLPTTEPFPDAAALSRARETFARQRRLAVRTLCLLGVLLLGTSGLLAALPQAQRLAVAGLPVGWLLLMGGSYPLLILLGALHVRSAERTEQAGHTERRAEHVGQREHRPRRASETGASGPADHRAVASHGSPDDRYGSSNASRDSPDASHDLMTTSRDHPARTTEPPIDTGDGTGDSTGGNGPP